MVFSAGDRVKFLNAKGGGIVSKVLDSRMVSVSTEGGFEIPTLISELVKIDENNAAARFFLDDPGPAPLKESPIPAYGADTEDDHMSLLPSTVVKNRKAQEISLAFTPHDQKWLISGLLDVYLINNTDFDILYNLFLNHPTGGFYGRDYGSCFPGSRLLLATITREELPEWSSGFVQFLFHAARMPEVLPPFNSEFRISGQKFYQENSYRESVLLEGKSLVAKIVSVPDTLRKPGPSSPGEKTAGENPGETNLLRVHMTGRREAEVDLHIHELIEDPAEMEGIDVLQYQKDYFIRCLESAIANHVLKMTVIHGIGNGILRENLLEILKHYEGLVIHDAPMQKYGAGAIEIRIPHNR